MAIVVHKIVKFMDNDRKDIGFAKEEGNILGSYIHFPERSFPGTPRKKKIRVEFSEITLPATPGPPLFIINSEMIRVSLPSSRDGDSSFYKVVAFQLKILVIN